MKSVKYYYNKVDAYHRNLTRILIISTLGNYFLQFNYAPQCDSLLNLLMELIFLKVTYESQINPISNLYIL